MQTILGAGGAIGIELARALPQYTNDIRLVSRNPKRVNPGDQLMPANILDQSSLDKAVQGSSIVYVTVGFEYNVKIWRKTWPPFIRNVIDSCIKHHCKLVFFDNVYMYDIGHIGNMTEETPINPPSEKGKVRAELVNMIMSEVLAGKLNALIARSADFYGPHTGQNGLLTETVFKPLSKGKTANWMGSDDKKHSFTYTPDAGKATALLGNSPEAYNQVWHVPTASNPLTGKEWVEAIAGEFGVKPNYRTVSKFMLRVLGLFIPVMREMPEMFYQNDRDYIFRSDKFEKHFNLAPTPYIEGIAETIKRDYKK